MYKAVSDRELNYLTGQLVNKIDNKVDSINVVEEPSAHKILKLDESGKFPANILNGKIPLENIPQGALERCIIVADDEARFELRQEDVQIGDTVKVIATNKMFYVKDDTQLYDENGYEIYSSGSAEKLTNGRNIRITGDGEGNAYFDGTSDIDINLIISMLSGILTLGEENYGDTFPTEATKGRLFLKKVAGNSVSTKVVLLNNRMYGNTLPSGSLVENDVFFLKLDENV